MTNTTLYMLPAFLVGGLVAFFFGRRIVSRVRNLFARWRDPAPTPAVAATAPAVYAEPIRPVERRMTASEKAALHRREQELMAEEALAQREATMYAQQRAREVAAFQERWNAARVPDVLTPADDAPPAATGPLTEFIALSEANVAKLKAAYQAQKGKAPVPNR